MNKFKLEPKFYILKGTGFQGDLRKAFMKSAGKVDIMFKVRIFGVINLN